jgi:phage terminase small subunit
MPKLNQKQILFVQEYLIDLNATQACIRAGYSEKTSRQMGTENLSKPAIQKAIAEAMEARMNRIEITQDAVLQEIAKTAFMDIGGMFNENNELLPINEIPENLRRAIGSFEVSKTMVGSETLVEETLKKVRLLDKTKNLELLGRHLKMFTDKVAVEGLEDLLVKIKYV